MKTKILLIVFSLVSLTSCKKEDVDPREQYLGSYDVKAQKIAPNVAPETDELMIVSKSDKINGLWLTLSFGKLPATLGSNGNIVIDKSTYSYTSNGSVYDADYTGDGTIAGSDLLMTLRIALKQAGQSSSITTSLKGKKRP